MTAAVCVAAAPTLGYRGVAVAAALDGGGIGDGKHADKSCAGLIRGCCFYVCVVL